LISKGEVTKESLRLLYYLKICLNPHIVLPNINFDFNQFYEDNENMTLRELQEKVNN